MKKLILASVAVIALAATGASAEELKVAKKGTIKLDVRLTNVALDASGDILVKSSGADTTLNVDAKAATVPTIGIEYYLTDNISVEAIAGTATHKISATNATTNALINKVGHVPPTITGKYHFATGTAFKPYVGAGLTYIFFTSHKAQNGYYLDVKNDYGFALQAGLDYDLQGPYSVNFDVKKIFFETKADAWTPAPGPVPLVVNNLKLDPLVVSLGVGYKF